MDKKRLLIMLISTVSVSLFLVFSASNAMAVPYTISIAGAGQGVYDSSGIVYNAASSASASFSNSSTDSYATTNAAFGALGVEASSFVYGSGMSGAHGQAYFYDAIRVTSDTLAVGTPVSLLLSHAIYGGFNYGGVNSMYGYLSSRIDVGYQSYTVYERLYQYVYSESTTGDPSFETTVGAYFPLNSALYVTITAYSNSWAEGSFGNTANYYVDSQTAGISLVSDSGHDYTTPAANPVPEPSSIILLGSGMAGLAGIGIMKRRKKG